MLLSAGDRLGPYEILAPLGSGGMGEVYKARDPRLGREVAIKLLRGGALAGAERTARFMQEARAALNRARVRFSSTCVPRLAPALLNRVEHY